MGQCTMTDGGMRCGLAQDHGGAHRFTAVNEPCRASFTLSGITYSCTGLRGHRGPHSDQDGDDFLVTPAASRRTCGSFYSPDPARRYECCRAQDHNGTHLDDAKNTAWIGTWGEKGEATVFIDARGSGERLDLFTSGAREDVRRLRQYLDNAIDRVTKLEAREKALTDQQLVQVDLLLRPTLRRHSPSRTLPWRSCSRSWRSGCPRTPGTAVSGVRTGTTNTRASSSPATAVSMRTSTRTGSPSSPAQQRAPSLAG